MKRAERKRKLLLHFLSLFRFRVVVEEGMEKQVGRFSFSSAFSFSFCEAVDYSHRSNPLKRNQLMQEEEGHWKWLLQTQANQMPSILSFRFGVDEGMQQGEEQGSIVELVAFFYDVPL